MVNSPLIRPYFLGGGGIGGVPLDSHDKKQRREKPAFFPKVSTFCFKFPSASPGGHPTSPGGHPDDSSTTKKIGKLEVLYTFHLISLRASRGKLQFGHKNSKVFRFAQ